MANLPINESFESGGYGVFTHEYAGSSIVNDEPTPLGSYTLKFNFPSGYPAGNAPDVVSVAFASQQEIYARSYFKLSSVFTYEQYEQKLIFIWGATFNFYLSIGRFGNHRIFGCHQGPGTVYENSGSPNISTGQWYKLDWRMKMNSGAGVTDGIFQAWLDDSLILNFSNIPYRVSGAGADGGFNTFSYTPVWGGSVGTVPQNQYIWFDGAQVTVSSLGNKTPSLNAYLKKTFYIYIGEP